MLSAWKKHHLNLGHHLQTWCSVQAPNKCHFFWKPSRCSRNLDLKSDRYRPIGEGSDLPTTIFSGANYETSGGLWIEMHWFTGFNMIGCMFLLILCFLPPDFPQNHLKTCWQAFVMKVQTSSLKKVSGGLQKTIGLSKNHLKSHDFKNLFKTLDYSQGVDIINVCKPPPGDCRLSESLGDLV